MRLSPGPIGPVSIGPGLPEESRGGRAKDKPPPRRGHCAKAASSGLLGTAVVNLWVCVRVGEILATMTYRVRNLIP